MTDILIVNTLRFKAAGGIQINDKCGKSIHTCDKRDLLYGFTGYYKNIF